MKSYLQNGRLVFYCFGCLYLHSIPVNSLNDEFLQWEWNGDLNSPSVTPSIRNAWESESRKYCCHLHVTDGKIIYANDCTHGFVNQTIEMKII